MRYPLVTVLCAVGLACSAGESRQGTRQASARGEQPRALCLLALRGDRLPARDLRAQQQRAREKPEDVQAWVAAGHGFVRMARADSRPELYRNAEACAQLALARSPEHRAALALRGLGLMNDHRFAEARALALRLIAGDADDPQAYGLLSDAELELGDLQAAIRTAQQMLDLKPSLMSYGRAAHLRFLQGDNAGAKRLYQLAIEAGRRDRDREPSAFMISEAALLFWHEGDYAGADGGFDYALTQVADYAPALEGKGRVALARGDHRAAAALFERALARRASVETAWLLGDARSLAGDARGAQQAYARVVRDGERHDPRTLALFYAVKGRAGAEALRLARAEFAERKELYTKATLAFALHRAGEHAQALRLSDEVLATGIKDARLLHRGGEIANAAGQPERGERLIAEARKLNPQVDQLYANR